MSELNLSLKHHRTLEEARRGLEDAVREAQARFEAMIQKVEWSADRNTVSLSGTGFTGRVNVSPTSDMELLVEDQIAGQGATPAATVSISARTTWLMATLVLKHA